MGEIIQFPMSFGEKEGPRAAKALKEMLERNNASPEMAEFISSRIKEVIVKDYPSVTFSYSLPLPARCQFLDFEKEQLEAALRESFQNMGRQYIDNWFKLYERIVRLEIYLYAATHPEDFK